METGAEAPRCPGSLIVRCAVFIRSSLAGQWRIGETVGFMAWSRQVRSEWFQKGSPESVTQVEDQQDIQKVELKVVTAMAGPAGP
jgi:hypothetical protein